MKKLLFGTILSILALVAPISAMADVDVQIGIGVPLPPAVVFPAPPSLIVIPDTYVYAVPDIEHDIYFYNGWWWRPWEGRWYRSQYYNRGWAYYRGVPGFYYQIDPGWRGHYRNRSWNGHRWNYERIPQHRIQNNWKSWRDNRYWERHGNWGVQGYRPQSQQQKRELRKQREEQYRQAPRVQQQPRPIQPQHKQPQSREVFRPPQPQSQPRQQTPWGQYQPGQQTPWGQQQPRQVQPHQPRPQQPHPVQPQPVPPHSR